jgi:2'-5' RNA ligase
MRLFVGIPLHPTVLNELSAVVVRLRSKSDNLRWMAPESWHITLQFLGDTNPEQYECLITRLAEVHSKAVSVHLSELGFFDRAGVFFADVVPTPELVSLADHVMEVTHLCNFLPEPRPFHPHITLARTKGQSRGKSLRVIKENIHGQTAFTRFTAAEFLLYESHLSQTGSTYQIRHRFPFSATG